MKIRIQNEIYLDGEMEVIEEIRDVELIEKNDTLYLIYHNDAKERVVLKVTSAKCVMTRFSKPKSVMQFIPQEVTIAHMTTPAGTQIFQIITENYQQNHQQLALDYQIQLPGTQQVLARYSLRISWGQSF